jgi:glutamate/tyrosine decarboxylase-like PLP-dependent enzyme
VPIQPPDWDAVLDRVRAHALAHLEGMNTRPVRAWATDEELVATLGGALPDGPVDPVAVIERLAGVAPAGLTCNDSARFFGFVIGGAVPAALGADLLATAWDQNAGLHAAAPAEAVVEEVARGWLCDLLALPADASIGYVTGGQQANTTCLGAARHHVLAAAGWDVETDGLHGGPPVTVVASAERHHTVDYALRQLGLGARMRLVDCDAQGAMDADAARAVLGDCDGPTIVCTQVGNVNTGAVDPVADVVEAAHERGAWVHVDGAFGLWAAAGGTTRHLVDGVATADSWATDAHKWLSVPYDSGLALTAHPAAHTAAWGTGGGASYLEYGAGVRDQLEWVPDFSRRGRGFAVWAALASLGRLGVAELVDRLCAMARRFAAQLAALDGVRVVNDVVLNQVLVDAEGVDVRAWVAAVQRDGTCWPSPTTWRGRDRMRISVCNWQTTEEDVDASVAAMARCLEAQRG